MRNLLAFAPMWLALASAPALALDDTPTVAPHFQIKGEDNRQPGRPAAAGASAASAPPARRLLPEMDAARDAARQALTPRGVLTTVLRPLPAQAGLMIEKPRWKLR
ncbi:hypothetical protein [Duganella sp. HH101]|uniref:hypothetical protein n=1 Tax=Duganella sp. HH101 TaxID=1781066 RepID=UPI0008755B00|nr:hypothetical protein [Duganella sp. HH101]OFA00134.1 hypothetical protein DUGA2_49660 [Duganella sp. HH101]